MIGRAITVERAEILPATLDNDTLCPVAVAGEMLTTRGGGRGGGTIVARTRLTVFVCLTEIFSDSRDRRTEEVAANGVIGRAVTVFTAEIFAIAGNDDALRVATVACEVLRTRRRG